MADKNLQIPTPSKEQLELWINKEWSDEKTRAQENALKKLFCEIYPKNNDWGEILIKVTTLDACYKTNIRFSGFWEVASHILKIKNIDERLQNGDESLVSEIANVSVGDNKIKTLYSFASKYCSFHNAEKFAIYDSYVDELLWHFQKADKFSDFKRDELKDYAKFKRVLNDFKTFYHLEDCDLKKLDQYLWALGKEFF